MLQISIMDDGKILQNEEILNEFAGVESNLTFVAKEVKYHSSCQKKFHNEAMSKKASQEKKDRSDWEFKSNARDQAFTAITSFVEEFILTREEVHKAKDVADHHRMLQAEGGLHPDYISRGRDYNFFSKLDAHFEGKIVILKHPVKGVGKIIFSSTIAPAKAFSTPLNQNNCAAYKVRYSFLFSF